MYPYDSSIEYSTVVENGTNQMNLTNQSVISSININITPSSCISDPGNTANDDTSLAVSHSGGFQHNVIPNSSIILPESPVLRRSQRLSVLYKRKQSPLLEDTASFEFAKPQKRRTIARRGPGRPRKADKVQVLPKKAKNVPKTRSPSNSILQGRKIFSEFVYWLVLMDNLIFHDSNKRWKPDRKLHQCQNGPSKEHTKDSEQRRHK